MSVNEAAAVVTCVKTLLFISNTLLWLTGILLVIFGLWAELEMHKYMALAPEISNTAPHTIVGIGLLMLLVCTLAFPAIFYGNLLYTYGGLMMCMVMLVGGLSASLYCYLDSFHTGLHEGLTKTVTAYDSFDANLDFAQANLHCCGVSNYTDWIRLSPQRVIPTSCCIDPNNCVTANYNDVYQKGCYDVIIELTKNNKHFLIIIVVSAVLLPFIASIISCGLGGLNLCNQLNRR